MSLTCYFRHHAKQLIGLSLILAIWMSCVTVPVYSARRPTPPAKASKAKSSKPAEQPAPKKIATNSSPVSVFTPNAPSQPIQRQVNEAYGKLPLSFEANQGQIDPQVKFLSRGLGYSLFLTSTEAVFALSKSAARKARKNSLAAHGATGARTDMMTYAVMRMKLIGANPAAEVEGLDPLAGKSSYFIGNDPAKWRTDIPTYARVQYRDVYPGVNIIYYGNQRQLEYDLVVAPGANPDVIQLGFEGIKRMRVDANGDLVLRVAGGEIRQRKPMIYQEADGVRQSIAGCYVIQGRNQVGFKVARYDASRPLVIDPVLAYSTYLGGGGTEYTRSLAVDSSGNAYVAGWTSSTNFPVTPGAYRTTSSGNVDVFVSKINPTGSDLVYSTYLGGSDEEYCYDIAVDFAGNAYAAGATNSANFPTTPGAFQTAFQGSSNVFVVKLNATGSGLAYSTYLGNGAIYFHHNIAVDSTGNAFVTGATNSANFPTTPGAFQTTFGGGAFDAYVTKLNAAGSGLVYSTYLGGSDWDHGQGIVVDSAGNAYVAGNTLSNNFPITQGAFQTSRPGQTDGFVTKVNAAGNGLVYSTYLGGSSGDTSIRVAVDSAGNAYVTGYTHSTNFPITSSAFQTSFRGGPRDAYVTKLNPLGNGLAYSTYLGGNNEDTGDDIAVDSAGNAYVVGGTRSPNFPTTPDAFQTTFGGGNWDVLLTKLNTTAMGTESLIYSTYLGGSDSDEGTGVAVDSSSDVYVSGGTTSINFPTTGFAFQPTLRSGFDAFITKFLLGTPTSLSVSSILPNRGGDTGNVTVLIHGGGFLSGATVKLTRAGQPDIVGERVSVGVGGRTITATFDLRGRARGLWDVVVTNPGSTSATLTDGFTIEEGRAPQVWVDIIGRDRIALGRPQTFTIVYGNRGNVDEIGVLLSIHGIPRDATFEPLFQTAQPSPLPGRPPLDFSQVPVDIVVGQEKIPSLLIPRIPPGRVAVLPFRLRLNNLPPPPPLRPPPPPQPPFPPVPPGTSVVNLSVVTSTLGFWCSPNCNLAIALSFVPGGGCVLDWICLHLQALFAAGAPDQDSPVPLSWTVLQALLDCLGIFDPTRATTIIDILLNCFSDPVPASAATQVQVVASIDPNDKVGSRGTGLPRYLSGEEPLRYAVLFENIETATAPAQEVVITDHLDVDKLDLSTFSLGPIVFGNRRIVPPPGLSEYSTDVDLRPATNLIVRIAATLNRTTGLLTWRFTSIDPVTGQLPEDPLVGFLPPNRNPPEGEGSVLFTVMPRQTLTTGTEIRNRARIVFDVNPPIDTEEWLNTIDNSRPTSSVLPLAATQTSTSFDVQWSGTDVGSGVRHYTIYVSEDGGPFSAWLSHTTATSGIFTGQPGKTYAFNSVAEDQTGNREDARMVADTTTRVIAADLAITKVPSQNTVRPGSDLIYTIAVTNNGPDAATSVIVTDNLPAETTFISCTSTGEGVCGGSGSSRTVSFTSLAAGASETITLVVRVSDKVAYGTIISNTATISSATPDPDSSNNSATTLVMVSGEELNIADAIMDKWALWPTEWRKQRAPMAQLNWTYGTQWR